MRRTVLLVLLTAGAASLAAWLFPRAFPIVAVERRIGRQAALERADSFFVAHELAPDGARRAIRFASDDSLRTFIELEAGGRDSLEALLRAGDVALFSWRARAFVPGEVREARLTLSPDGRVLGFRRVLPDSLVRPALDSAQARIVADGVLATWLDQARDDWDLVTASYVTQPGSGRVDRTFTYERRDRRIGTAPIRIDVVVAGDLAAEARPHVVIPEGFARRYGEMRSANNLLALVASMGILALAIVGVVALRRYARDRQVRWRPPVLVGAVIGAFFTAAVLNDLPSTWFTYDTATPAPLHQLVGVLSALAAGAGSALMIALTLAAAEALTRHAFPWHADWWQLWRFRGTREVGMRVLGGYAMAAAGFAYIAAFYLATRSWFGWWVPSEMLDDPNQIATAFPWVAGIGLSLQAAIWEEALFRAIPLSLLSIWLGGREDRERWMALGVVATALVFGFAHSDYPSWPPYSRGVEIFLEACLWAVLFLRFGILVPVLAHFAYDLVLFGLFATAGTAPEYRLTAAVMLLALAAPALAVLWARLRQGHWQALPDEGRFGAWAPGPPPARVDAGAAPVSALVTPRSRAAALACAGLAVAGIVARPVREVVGPRYTATRSEAVAAADSVMGTRGQDPGSWRRLVSPATDTLGSFRRLLEQEAAESLAVTLGSTYAIPTWWQVRYVRTDTAVAARAEEWRVRVRPDGRALDARHFVPDEAPGASLPEDSARALAQGALRLAGIDRSSLVEADLQPTDRPGRRDYRLTFTDTTARLPGGALARVRVEVAGDEVLSVRRAVELPEAFLRDARRREVTGMAASAGFAIAILVLVIAGIVRLSRRPFRVDDGVPARLRLGLLATLAAAMLAGSLQSHGTMLAQYDTRMPWDRFVATTVATEMFVVLASLMLALLWLLANGMRRRAGIPLLAPGRGWWPDDVLLGLGLGGVVRLATLGSAWVLPPGVPGGPGTNLDEAIPLLSALPDVVMGPAMVPVFAIPALAVTGLATRSRGRLVAAFLLAVLVAGAMYAADYSSGAPRPLAVAWSLVAITGVVLAFRAWGGASVTVWVFAALFSDLADAFGTVLRAGTPTERGAAVLGLLATMLLILLVHRWSSRQRSVLGHPAGQSAGGPDQDVLPEPSQHVE